MRSLADEIVLRWGPLGVEWALIQYTGALMRKEEKAYVKRKNAMWLQKQRMKLRGHKPRNTEDGQELLEAKKEYGQILPLSS